MKKEVVVFGVKNENGRIYPKSMIQKIVKQINSNPHKLGELSHSKNAIVNLSNVSHKYDNPCIENDKLFVDIKILDTPSGMILKTLIDDVSFKLRGYGTLNKKGIVKDDYILISIDAVP